jgi:ribosomal protein S18 acetylase RimI-like enzyme
MVSVREAAVSENSAQVLLAEYFTLRADSFPTAQGTYTPTLPNPAHFVPPTGVFLIVEGEDTAGDAADIGCGGIRLIDFPTGEPGHLTYEIKHVWVQPHTRGQGLGRALLSELERRARHLGARALVLDTNNSLAAAGGLYRSSGFVDIPAYNSNPNATNWYRKQLD